MTDAKELGSWFAGIPLSTRLGKLGRGSLMGGTLKLTHNAVTFEPIGRLGRRKIFNLAEITEVRDYNDRPPQLIIKTRSGQLRVLTVLPSRFTSIFSRDCSARDDAVSVISSRLSSNSN